MPTHSCSAASVYSGYEVDDDWCASVLQSYQAEKDTLFPWTVGESPGCTQYYPTPMDVYLPSTFARSHTLF